MSPPRETQVASPTTSCHTATSPTTSSQTISCHTTGSLTTNNKLPPQQQATSNLKTHLGDGEVTEMLRRKSLKEKRLRMQINVRASQNTFGSSLLTAHLPITRFSAITAEMYRCRKSARNLQIYISPRFLTAIDSQAFDIHVLFSLQVSARGGC